MFIIIIVITIYRPTYTYIAVLPMYHLHDPPTKNSTFVRDDNCETRSRRAAVSRIYLCYTSVLINKHYPHPANLRKSSFPSTHNHNYSRCFCIRLSARNFLVALNCNNVPVESEQQRTNRATEKKTCAYDTFYTPLFPHVSGTGANLWDWMKSTLNNRALPFRRILHSFLNSHLLHRESFPNHPTL